MDDDLIQWPKGGSACRQMGGATDGRFDCPDSMTVGNHGLYAAWSATRDIRAHRYKRFRPAVSA